MPTNNEPLQHRGPDQVDEFGNVKPNPHPVPKLDADHPGYETTDVNTNGVLIFLAGLLGTIIVFFGLCYVMGKAINTGLSKQDSSEARLSTEAPSGSESAEKRMNLAPNPYMEQQDSARIAKSFPSPRLDADDGNQNTSDIHAREDLLLEHTSVSEDGTVRIPIEQAMALIAQRGLGSPAAADQRTLMAGEHAYKVTAPLTNGFARTAYEIQQIESREQALKLSEPEGEKK